MLTCFNCCDFYSEAVMVFEPGECAVCRGYLCMLCCLAVERYGRAAAYRRILQHMENVK